MKTITREEQIKQAAQAYYPQGTLHEEKAVSAFIRGAKWADANPQFSKEGFIEKVKRWLELETNWNMEYDDEGRNPNYGKIDELIKYLEK